MKKIRHLLRLLFQPRCYCHAPIQEVFGGRGVCQNGHVLQLL